MIFNCLKSSLSNGSETMLLEPPETRGYLPVLGSNFSDFTYYDNSKFTTYPYKLDLTYSHTINPDAGLYSGFVYDVNTLDEVGSRTTHNKIGVHSQSPAGDRSWSGILAHNPLLPNKNRYYELKKKKVLTDLFLFYNFTTIP